MKGTVIKHLGLALLLNALLIGFGAVAMAADGDVTIHSDTVKADSIASIGIFVRNDLDIKQYVQPLKIFADTVGHANIKSLAIKDGSATSRFHGRLGDIAVHNGYVTQDGTCLTTPPNVGFKTISWNDTLTHTQDLDTLTPKPVRLPIAFMIVRGKIVGALTVPPGTDAPTDPSFFIEVGVDTGAGTFIIDTVCTNPANHLLMVKTTGTPNSLVPSFGKGTITVVAPIAVQYLGGDGIPRDYALDQNYPNPFNASTVIKFNTKHDGNVRLTVYNILGQPVRTLVDEFRHYGPQAVDWDGADVSGRPVASGMYFYRLVTEDFTAVKKMVLLK